MTGRPPVSYRLRVPGRLRRAYGHRVHARAWPWRAGVARRRPAATVGPRRVPRLVGPGSDSALLHSRDHILRKILRRYIQSKISQKTSSIEARSRIGTYGVPQVSKTLCPKWILMLS